MSIGGQDEEGVYCRANHLEGKRSGGYSKPRKHGELANLKPI
jgi:hypothetical protein